MLPPFNDNGWYSDGNPTCEIDPVNPHKMVMNVPVGANGRLINIPVESGKAYTFSFKNMNGLYRLYRRKVPNHDPAMVLIQDGTAGKPDTFTFVVDDSYQGFVTLRLTQSFGGKFTFENMQIEEAWSATSFEPYKLGLKKAVMPKNILMPDISGTSHAYAVGNVIQVDKDVRLRKSTINVVSNGVFNVAVYEWKDGIGAIGDPLFRKDTTFSGSAGNYPFDFGGLLLKGGKKYWFGRLESSNMAGMMRPFGAADTTPKGRFTLLGGTRQNDTVISFPSTYYYFFGLEVESTENKPATRYPKKNLFPRENLVNGSWQGSPLGINTGSNLYRALKDPIKLKAGTYTISTRGDVNAAALNAAGTVLFGTNDTIPRSFTITLDSLVHFHFRKKDSSVWDTSAFPFDVETLGLQLEEGSTATPFEPQKLINKPATLYPKNLFDYSKVTTGFYVNDANGTLSASGAGACATDFTPVKGGKTYIFENMPETFKLIMRFAWYDVNKTYIGGSNYYSASNAPKEVNAPPNAAYIRSSVVPSDFSKGSFYEKGSAFINKPAILYPQKNMFPYDPNIWMQGTINGNNGSVLGSTTRLVLKKENFIPVKGGKTYRMQVMDNVPSDVKIREMYWYKKDGTFIAPIVGAGMTYTRGATVTAPSGAELFAVQFVPDGESRRLDVSEIFDKVQFEEGTVATPYERYKLGNKSL